MARQKPGGSLSPVLVLNYLIYMVKDLKVIFGKGPGSQPVPDGPDRNVGAIM
jgi:hypothetical protein